MAFYPTIFIDNKVKLLHGKKKSSTIEAARLPIIDNISNVMKKTLKVKTAFGLCPHILTLHR
ncbi:MAG: hypothetical protein C4518_14830 [Desulfobacteraceae bacterium]|nr:MAG: hypothetical protein C4518_14830 [Desulfobacteraceae bacterium]